MEHIADGSWVVGRLKEIKGNEVVLLIPGELLTLPLATFPSQGWVEYNIGKLVTVDKERGKPIKIKLADMSGPSLKGTQDQDSGKIVYGCTACGKKVLTIMPADIHDKIVIGKGTKLYMKHLAQDHPEEVERLRQEGP